MSLTLTRPSSSPVPIELEGIIPELVRGLSPPEISRLEILHGNRAIPLAEAFRVSGDPSDGRIVLAGDLAGVHRIGAAMTGGEIVVDGKAGRHVGAGMSGGSILVDGDAGDWLGAEMKGGTIRVMGAAGDRVGSAYPGGRVGMKEGVILIEGSAGDCVGASMRRGLIAIGGRCGEACGLGMIAGTILVSGECGARTGAEMRRGTLGLLGPGTPNLPPTFRRAGRFRPLFLRLYARELQRSRFPFDQDVLQGELTLYHGDLLALARGEIWVREEQAGP